MKLFHSVVVLLPAIAFAAGYGGAEGGNRLGEIIRIEGDVPDTIYIQKGRKDSEWKERYDLNQECPNFQKIFEGAKYFSCRVDSKSPLTGTRFRVTLSKKYQPCNVEPLFDKTPGEIYLCVEGCNKPRVPQKLIVSPWECI
ncbi:hypothetical protein [Chitinimonas sp.]|uniref:hypothetical protein n=1 Tax=Chitinimonas sp. TaxID=1934313 RepID=UPI0035B4C181